MVFIEKNIGGGRVESGGGDLAVRTGDEMLDGRQIDLMKIDVEGMEIDVLAGFAETVARHRPSVFAEVDNNNRAAFDDWVADNHYVVTERFKRYRSNENFMIIPREKTEMALGHSTLSSVAHLRLRHNLQLPARNAKGQSRRLTDKNRRWAVPTNDTFIRSNEC